MQESPQNRVPSGATSQYVPASHPVGLQAPQPEVPVDELPEVDPLDDELDRLDDFPVDADVELELAAEELLEALVDAPELAVVDPEVVVAIDADDAEEALLEASVAAVVVAPPVEEAELEAVTVDVEDAALDEVAADEVATVEERLEPVVAAVVAVREDEPPLVADRAVLALRAPVELEADVPWALDFADPLEVVRDPEADRPVEAELEVDAEFEVLRELLAPAEALSELVAVEPEPELEEVEPALAETLPLADERLALPAELELAEPAVPTAEEAELLPAEALDPDERVEAALPCAPLEIEPETAVEPDDAPAGTQIFCWGSQTAPWVQGDVGLEGSHGVGLKLSRQPEAKAQRAARATPTPRWTGRSLSRAGRRGRSGVAEQEVGPDAGAHHRHREATPGDGCHGVGGALVAGELAILPCGAVGVVGLIAGVGEPAEDARYDQAGGPHAIEDIGPAVALLGSCRGRRGCDQTSCRGGHLGLGGGDLAAIEDRPDQLGHVAVHSLEQPLALLALDHLADLIERLAVGVGQGQRQGGVRSRAAISPWTM